MRRQEAVKPWRMCVGGDVRGMYGMRDIVSRVINVTVRTDCLKGGTMGSIRFDSRSLNWRSDGTTHR